jgi:hypothetical protein
MTQLFFLAASVSLAWDPSPSQNVVGYRLYYGPTPGMQTVFVDAGLKTSETVDIPPGKYYFVARAYNATGESGPSNEVEYVQAAPVPTPTSVWQQSQITDLRVLSGSDNSVIITWTKPAAAVNHAIYWDDDVPTGPLPLRSHDSNPPHAMGYINPGKIYYFEVRAINSAGEKTLPSNRIAYPQQGPTPTPAPTPTPTR